MARPLIVPSHLPVEELERRYRRARDSVLRSHWQIVWLLARGSPTAEVAGVTGYSGNWVREVARRWREGGPDALGDRRHGNPGAAPLLDAAGQEELRRALGGAAPDGGLWTGRKVAAWLAARLGRPVAEQRGWESLRRLGFTPQRPRPRETRADAEAQAAFKQGGSMRPSMRSPRPTPAPRRRCGPRTSTGSACCRWCGASGRPGGGGRPPGSGAATNGSTGTASSGRRRGAAGGACCRR